MRAIRPFLLLALSATPAVAQTIDDGFMMSKRVLTTGLVYGHDRWDQYWEGTRKRSNDNIGTLTTQSVAFAGHYGVSDRLSVIAMLPYVWTHSSEGTLHGMRGVQDLTLAAKYRLLTTAFTEHGRVNAIVVAAAGIPVGDYTPDFLPLSIGSASRRFTSRFALSFESNDAWFVSGSAAHTWRNKVRLDRPAYFTDGQLYLTNEVSMPRVFDYVLSAGYRKGRLYVPISLSEQRTLGGGDMRRQDMPFVSNRMNYTKLDGMVMYALNIPKAPALRLGATRTVSGRNVGEATTITLGALYTFNLSSR
jgi:outer membrane putative beta-barrel porin/alpha-amylase